MVFANRQEAGKTLAASLLHYKNIHPIIVALPRGGVPIGYEIAKTLQAPLTVIVARKIGDPMRPEFGIGAIAEGNVHFLNEVLIERLSISQRELKEIIEREEEELARRVMLYRKHVNLPVLRNAIVILVDDGLATGVTARAAIASLKLHKPKQIIFAAPVCANDVARELRMQIDSVTCVTTPDSFGAVGEWYGDFEQITDEEVIQLLQLPKK